MDVVIGDIVGYGIGLDVLVVWIGSGYRVDSCVWKFGESWGISCFSILLDSL